MPTGTIYASTAMSFLLLATQYVAAKGHIMCVLPLGCLSSQKDERAWEFIKSRFRVEHLNTYRMGTFPDSAASTVLVRLSPGKNGDASGPHCSNPKTAEPTIHASLIRGGCQLHKIRKEKGQPILVHYTDIKNGSVRLNGRRGHGAHNCVEGPVVLLPRVGRVTPGKVAILEHSSRVMLSDCVIAIRPSSREQTQLVRERLIRNFSSLRSNYLGTCAPHITLGRLRSALSLMGVIIE